MIGACFGASCHAARLHAENLPDAFFHLSSGQARAIRQKLRDHGVRPAVVAPADGGGFSSRFGGPVAEGRTRRDFGVLATRGAAPAWPAGSPEPGA